MDPASPDHSIEAVASLVDRLGGLRVAVVGDCMIDRFVHGSVDRISPEAPVPVVHVSREEERLGGAANVAANVAALGAAAHLFGVCGPDAAGGRLRGLLRRGGIEASGLTVVDDRITTVKTRILAGGQQVVRIDHEDPVPVGAAALAGLVGGLLRDGPFDAVIVSDYGKGVVQADLLEVLQEQRRRGRPVVVDPKQGSFELYRGVTAITPNQREAAAACHAVVAGDSDVEAIGETLRRRLELPLLLITRGEAGMSLFADGAPVLHIPTEATRVFDVTGAGDTVISTFTTMLAAGADAALAARLANTAAGVVVRELGTAAVRSHRIREAWRKRRRSPA